MILISTIPSLFSQNKLNAKLLEGKTNVFGTVEEIV